MKHNIDLSDLFDRLYNVEIDNVAIAKFASEQLGVEIVYVGDGHFVDATALEKDDEHDDPFHGRDGDADADALASAGMGTDEDYGDFGQNEEHCSGDE